MLRHEPPSAKVERTGFRDLTYSAWHRTLSASLAMIDVDSVECCWRCFEPLALIEVTRDNGKRKSSTLIRKLARKAGIQAWVVRYRTDGSFIDEQGRKHDSITQFMVSKVMPDGWGTSKAMMPEEWAEVLRSMRRGHSCVSIDGRTQRTLAFAFDSARGARSSDIATKSPPTKSDTGPPISSLPRAEARVHAEPEALGR